MNVHIAGVGLHPFGRFPLAVEELGRAAALARSSVPNPGPEDARSDRRRPRSPAGR